MTEPAIARAHAELARILVETDPTSLWAEVYARGGKRVFDLCVASVVLPGVALPLLGLMAVVRLRLGRPAFYKSRRLGQGRRPFDMYKLRTMLPDRRVAHDPHYRGPERRSPVPSPDDPRHTPLGRWLSSSSLDELPQLVHVLLGQMSVVGPRPDLVHRHDAYGKGERRRFDVPPGLTGPWQVMVGTGTNLHDYVALDLLYVDRQSFTNDLRLLLRTPWAVLRRPWLAPPR